MMSWQTHYKIAEKLLAKVDSPDLTPIDKQVILDKAMVHATLAKIGHTEYSEPIQIDLNPLPWEA